jgi:hypothetical protein
MREKAKMAAAAKPRFWVPSHDGDRHAYAMFRRHYSAWKNRRPKIRKFVAPGEQLVLIGFMCPALFAWSKQRFRLDGQFGVNCAVFRNESWHRSSEMILEAMELAWERWPGERLFTMIDPAKIRSTNPGYCFLCAGWRLCGQTARGLLILEVRP